MKQTLKYIYSIVYDDMKFAETKHSIILTLASAVTAFATTFFGGEVKQTLFAAAAIIFALIAILYSFVALVARNVKVKKRKIDASDNLLSYKDIMHYDDIAYVNAIKKKYAFTNIYKPDQMDYDLAKEIIVTSKLSHIKFIYFNFAVFFLIASIGCILTAVLIKGQVW